jgi:hypothetical protein
MLEVSEVLERFRTDKIPELYVSYPRIEEMFKCLKILIYSH